jgi:hypothetical protein
MHYFISPFRRQLVLHRRAGKGVDGFDSSAEVLFVEFEGFLAIPVEIQIWIQIHSFLPVWQRIELPL